MATHLHEARPTMGVVGAGTMGQGIAQLFAMAGMPTFLFDVRPEAAHSALRFIEQQLGTMAERGLMTAAKRDATLRCVQTVRNLEALAPCAVVVEAIAENLEAKQDLFRRLEPIVGDEAVLATNTSSLSVTAIASACQHPERVVGWHFFNPVPRMRIAEVIAAQQTRPAVVDDVAALTRTLGHEAVRAVDLPGFVVNHAGRAYGPEALRIRAEGIAEIYDIDAIMRDCAGFRMGPFQLLDLIGLDVALTVMTSLYEAYQQEPRFRITPWLERQVQAGLLGRKSGRGFYSYHDGKAQPIAAVAAQVRADHDSVLSCNVPVWVSSVEPDLADRVRSVLSRCGIEPEDGDQPSDNALIVVTPVGEDTTTTCLQLGLDPFRAVAVDALVDIDTRRCLMFAPGVRKEYRDAAFGLFTTDGAKVSLLRDSPGFVAQRIIAQIVAIACDMAQHRIATPDDIDKAVKLGLGYPLGPFELAERMGPRRILRILEALYRTYREPRYRPSAWLSRRVMLGLPLQTQD